jgi:hypothetical protein
MSFYRDMYMRDTMVLLQLFVVCLYEAFSMDGRVRGRMSSYVSCGENNPPRGCLERFSLVILI